MKNEFKSIALCAATALIVSSPLGAAEEEAGPEIAGWRVSAGANVGFGLRTKLRVTPGGMSSAAARAAALASLVPTPGGNRVDYGGGAFVDPVSNGGSTSQTWNWLLPESAARRNSLDQVEYFRLSREWTGYRTGAGSSGSVSDKDEAYGGSVDFSRLLYAAKDGSWGVDLAVGLQYLKCDDCFRGHGNMGTIESCRETVDLYTAGPLVGYTPVGGMYGPGYGDSLPAGSDRPSIVFDPAVVSSTFLGSGAVSANGDYDEWEISLLLRPWYDIFDWWRIRGALGVGFTRSEFEYSIDAILSGRSVYTSHHTEDEWRCHGLAGVGTAFAWKGMDIGVDAMFRFFNEDMDINSTEVQGSLEKPDFFIRVSLGYSF